MWCHQSHHKLKFPELLRRQTVKESKSSKGREQRMKREKSCEKRRKGLREIKDGFHKYTGYKTRSICFPFEMEISHFYIAPTAFSSFLQGSNKVGCFRPVCTLCMFTDPLYDSVISVLLRLTAWRDSYQILGRYPTNYNISEQPATILLFFAFRMRRTRF